MAKRAAALGASHRVDKLVRVVQIFQGLNCGMDAGITFDSDLARSVATIPGSVVWVAPNGERYGIELQAVVSNKCCRRFPLPRIVTYGVEHVPEARTKFNLPLHKANRLMRGGRKCGDWIVHHSNIDRTSANLVAMPLYQENGLPQESFRSFDDDNLCAAGVPERYKEIVYG